jgi:hypothetical protein
MWELIASHRAGRACDIDWLIIGAACQCNGYVVRVWKSHTRLWRVAVERRDDVRGCINLGLSVVALGIEDGH